MYSLPSKLRIFPRHFTIHWKPVDTSGEINTRDHFPRIMSVRKTDSQISRDLMPRSVSTQPKGAVCESLLELLLSYVTLQIAVSPFFSLVRNTKCFLCGKVQKLLNAKVQSMEFSENWVSQYGHIFSSCSPPSPLPPPPPPVASSSASSTTSGQVTSVNVTTAAGNNGAGLMNGYNGSAAASVIAGLNTTTKLKHQTSNQLQADPAYLIQLPSFFRQKA